MDYYISERGGMSYEGYDKNLNPPPTPRQKKKNDEIAQKDNRNRQR